jgi:phosphate-selective porin
VPGDPHLPNGLRGRTALSQDTFFAPVYVQGLRRRFEADLDWTFGPSSIRAEYMRVTDERRRQGIGDQDLPAVRSQAWYVSGSVIVTGERKRRPLRPDGDRLRQGWGSVELVGRVERLWFDSDVPAGAFPSRNPRAEAILASGDNAITAGANWAVNQWIKIQFNAVRQLVEDRERNPIAGGGSFWSRILRFQIVL